MYFLTLRLLPSSQAATTRGRLDIAGAVTVTASLMLAVYAIVNGNGNGWLSAETLGLLAAAAVPMAGFFVLESRVAEPLMPLAILKLRNIWASNLVGMLWAASMFAWFFLSALCMQKVLGYSPLQVGLAFLPANVIMAVFSVGLSARLVMRFGIKPPLVTGLGIASVGLVLFTMAPADGTFTVNVLPSMILLGIGAGMAFNPILLAAMSDVKPEESGLASGVVNTAFMMGGALGLAVLASLAAWRTGNLPAQARARPRRSPAATTSPSSSARSSPCRPPSWPECCCAPPRHPHTRRPARTHRPRRSTELVRGAERGTPRTGG